MLLFIWLFKYLQTFVPLSNDKVKTFVLFSLILEFSVKNHLKFWRQIHMSVNSPIIKFCCFIAFVGFGISGCTHKSKTTHTFHPIHKNPEIRKPAKTTDLPDAGEITNAPKTRHSEMFIVFDDSGSMDHYITNAQKAVVHLLVNTAATARASEIPFVHFFPLNSKAKFDVEYPYQDLIDYLKEGNPGAGGGTPLADRVGSMIRHINSQIPYLKKNNKSLGKIIIYIFTDGEPDGNDGETGDDWVRVIKRLNEFTFKDHITSDSGDYRRDVDVQLTVLGEAMSPELYAQFKDLQTNFSVKGFSFSVNRTENIEDIETEAQALAERLLVDRLESRISTSKHLVDEVQSTLPSLKSQLSELKSNNLLNLPDPAAIEKLLSQAIEEFKQDQTQQTAQGVVSEFRKISDVSSEIIKIRDSLIKLEATALNLHQRINTSGDDLRDTGETIDKMTEEQRGLFSDLISQYESVKKSFEDARNLLNQSGEGNRPLHTEIENILQSLTVKTKTVKKAYKTLFENSSSLVPFFESLPEDVRLKIEADLAVAKDVAIDYQNKTIIYTGVHYFKGEGGSGSSYQTDWTVINRGTIVNLGGSSGGGAIAKKFVNDGVILQSGSTQGQGEKGHTHIVNNGKIIRLTQKIPITCPKTHRPCHQSVESSEIICCPQDHTGDPFSPPRFHWQRYDKEGKAYFVIYNETDGSIYNVSWDFILNFKRGTTWGGKIYNFFVRLFSDSKVVDQLYKLEDVDSLQGDEAKAFLQSLYPERLKVLRRTEDQWLSLVPKDLIPVFEDILCIEGNGDLGYGKRALTDEALKRELEFKRRRQCGR